MGIFLQYRAKVNCVVCGKRFSIHYCKVCRRKEFGLCNSCHIRNKAHREELKGIKHA